MDRRRRSQAEKGISPRMKILLVEDEDRIASFVVKGLSAEGYELERAATGADALELAQATSHDLIILDLLLPDGNGREVLRALRAQDIVAPVLILSAVDEVEDKVELLDIGANDYLTKPFAFRELAARVRVLARSRSPAESEALTAADLTLDPRSREVTRAGRTVRLSPREFEVLEYLMRHAGQALSRQSLLDAVWEINFYTDSNVVDVYIRYLRRKLDESGAPSHIETVRGVGYRLRR